LNLQQDNEETYYACPYCLTEIVLDDEPSVTCDEPEETFEPEETKTEVEETKEQIPDKCMTCKDIVTCMLKKMKE